MHEVRIYTATERLALTESGEVVREQDPEARWLWRIEGVEITEADVLRYGLAGSPLVRTVA